MKKRKSNRGRGGNPAKQKPQARLPAVVTARVPNRPQPQLNSWPATVLRRAGTTTLSRDDRQSLALLLAPFLIVAASLASQQLLRTMPVRTHDAVVSFPAAGQVPAVAAPALPAAPTPTYAPIDFSALGLPPGVIPAERTTIAIRRAPPAAIEQPRIASLERPIVPESRPVPLPAPEPVPVPPYELPELALLPIPIPAPAPVPALVAPVPEPVIATPARPQAPVEVCAAPPGLLEAKVALRANVPDSPREFGLALAAAARAQSKDVVIYNARYQRIAYPMGDVAKLYGVCTDVVVRAYRDLGLDLQELIVTTRSGRGDAHIDHRRVEVIRRFMEKHGEKLPITEFAEDYQPGDIVTYYRPQNRTSTSHIAIVSDIVGPSGRYLIAHNRGWGTQLEDALFVDKITGHYRFMGLARSTKVASDPPAAVRGNQPKVAASQRSASAEGRSTAKR